MRVEFNERGSQTGKPRHRLRSCSARIEIHGRLASTTINFLRRIRVVVFVLCSFLLSPLFGIRDVGFNPRALVSSKHFYRAYTFFRGYFL